MSQLTLRQSATLRHTHVVLGAVRASVRQRPRTGGSGARKTSGPEGDDPEDDVAVRQPGEEIGEQREGLL